MSKIRTLTLLTLSSALVAACGGGGSSAPGANGSASPTPTATQSGTVSTYISTQPQSQIAITTGIQDGAGNSVVADILNNQLVVIPPPGGPSTRIGTAQANGSGAVTTANGSFAAAKFSSPTGMIYASGSTTQLIVADSGSPSAPSQNSPQAGCLRLVDFTAQTVSTFAGTCNKAASSFGTGQMVSPTDITYDSYSSTYYVTDFYANSVFSVTGPGAAPALLAGSAQRTPGDADGAGLSATFNGPLGITSDGKGSLYVSTADGTLRRIDLTNISNNVTTIAGHPGPVPSSPYQTVFPGVDGSSSGTFAYPAGLKFNPATGNLIVVDTVAQAIRVVSNITAGPGMAVIKTVVGVNGKASSTTGSPTNGPATTADFYAPVYSYLDGTTGNLYVYELQNNDVRVVKGQTF